MLKTPLNDSENLRVRYIFMVAGILQVSPPPPFPLNLVSDAFSKNCSQKSGQGQYFKRMLEIAPAIFLFCNEFFGNFVFNLLAPIYRLQNSNYPDR